MKKVLSRDVPPRAAAVVVALALLAGVVTGDERATAPVVIEPAAPRVAAPPAAEEDLDLEKLVRQPRNGERPDLFAGRSWTPPPPAVHVAATPPPPAPPPAPSAPPLPFKYLGRLADGDRLVVFLEKNQEPLSATVGDTIEGMYRVESISETAVNFLYVPLGAKQTLGISAPN